MSVEVSGEITAIATAALAVFAIVTALVAYFTFRKQSQEVSDQAEQLKLQRQANEMQAEAFVRGRVWAILTKEPGLRTVLALEKDDTGARVELLQRTADELDVAGAKTLGDKLRNVLRESWGAGTDDNSQKKRQEFVDSAIQFMNAPPA